MSYAVADIWMVIYVLSLPMCSCAVPGSVPLCVDISVICGYSLYSVFNVQDVILDLVYYFNRTLYR